MSEVEQKTKTRAAGETTDQPEGSPIDVERRRTIIRAALLSVPTIVTVTARPSFAASNVSGQSPVNAQMDQMPATPGSLRFSRTPQREDPPDAPNRPGKLRF